MSELDFGLLRPAPDLSAGFIQSYEAGRQMGRQRRADNALAALQQDPNNPQAQNELAVYAPQDYANVVATQDRARAGQARQAAGNVVAQYGAPWGNTVPQPSAPGPMAPQAPVAAQQAAVGTMQAPAQPPAPGGAPAAPQSPGMSPGMAAPPVPMTPQAIQASPLTNPAHPAAIAVGQQAAQGGLDPTQAWAALYRLDPEMGDHLVQSIQGMDKIRLTRLSDMEQALASAAQSLGKVPKEQRRASAMAMMPQLAAHGVTPQMIAQADLSDEGLQGIIGQAMGVKGMLDQHNAEVTQQFEQQRLGLQERQIRDNETKGEMQTVQNADGTTTSRLVNPFTGAEIGTTGTGAPGMGGNGGTGRRYTGPEIEAMATSAVPGIRVTSRVRDQATQQRLYDAYQAYKHGNGPWAPLAAPPGESGHQNATGEDLARDFTPPKGMTQEQLRVRLAAQFPGAQVLNEGNHVHVGEPLSRHGSASGARGTTLSGAPGAAMEPETIDFYAQKVAAGGDLPQLGMGKQAALMRQQILKRAAQIQQGGGMTGADSNALHAAVKADGQSLAALERQATLIRAAEIGAQSNAKLAVEMSRANGNGGVPMFNAWRNAGGRATGDPNIDKFNASVETFVNEYATVMGKGTPTDSLRAHAHDMLSTRQSPQQFEGVINVLSRDMANRSAAFDTERQATLSRIKSGGQGGATQIHSPADYARLPSGAAYIDPNGVHRTKK